MSTDSWLRDLSIRDTVVGLWNQFKSDFSERMKAKILWWAAKVEESISESFPRSSYPGIEKRHVSCLMFQWSQVEMFRLELALIYQAFETTYICQNAINLPKLFDANDLLGQKSGLVEMIPINCWEGVH